MAQPLKAKHASGAYELTNPSITVFNASVDNPKAGHLLYNSAPGTKGFLSPQVGKTGKLAGAQKKKD